MAQEAFAPATWSTSMGGDMSSIRVYYRSPKDEKVGGAVVWRSRGWTITPELFYCRRLPVTERHYFMQARMMDAMPGRSGDAKSKDGPSQAKHVTFEGFAGGLVASRSWHDGEQTLEDDVNEDDEESERLRKLAKCVVLSWSFIHVRRRHGVQRPRRRRNVASRLSFARSHRTELRRVR